MTSISLFPPVDQGPQGEPPQWGTGKLKGAENIWTPKQPTWHYNGEPTEQMYGLTQLKLSNVRLNDALLTSPQESNMHAIMIDKPFPAEHPYASHIERKAVFPKFDSPYDPRRGAAARNNMPKDPEMPSNPYDIIVLSKTKGSCRRHEVQALPPEGQKKPLYWPGDDHFDQQVKTPSSGQQQYYPIPPKVLVPNLEARSDSKIQKGNMVVTPRTANCLRNVEREQWETTYDLNHTGLGPSNPLKKDNLEDKKEQELLTRQRDDKLKPHEIRTFDPPRPQEGRIARQMMGNPRPQTERYPDPLTDSNYNRKMTDHEREEDRLWNGGQYVNLPENRAQKENEEEEWLRIQSTSHPDVGNTIIANTIGEPEQVPFKPAGAPAPTPLGPNDERAAEFHANIQQMEAQNRYNLLESQKPSHDVTAVQHKLALVSSKTQPKVFYNHEGKFQRERAGMYKTSYDPYSLQYSMNKDEKSGNRIMDYSDCHVGALDYPTALNNPMAEAMRENRTLGGPPGSVPQYNSQPSQYEAFGPFDREKARQKSALQPNVNTSDIKTQEGAHILRESTYGDSYNHEKFLQENQLPFHARNEPLGLMSGENNDLNRVRSSIPLSARPATSRLPTDYKRMSSAPGLMTARGEDVGELPSFSNRYSYQTGNTLSAYHSSQPADDNNLPVSLSKDRRAKTNLADLFTSQSSNVTAPSNLRHTWSNETSYQKDNAVPHFDLSYKNDERFNWKVGSGTPRPQTVLLDLQNAFRKSEVRKKFHGEFPETNPDLRENLVRGKKHEFAGMNAQVLRGTPVVA